MWAFDRPAVVTLNGQILGGLEELLEWADEHFNFKDTAQQKVSEALNCLTLDQKSSEHCQLATQEEPTEHENVLEQQNQTIPPEEKSAQQNPSSVGKTEQQEQYEVEVPLQQEQQMLPAFQTFQQQLSEQASCSSDEMTQGLQQSTLLQSNCSHRATQGEKPILIIDMKFEVFKDILR